MIVKVVYSQDHSINPTYREYTVECCSYSLQKWNMSDKNQYVNFCKERVTLPGTVTVLGPPPNNNAKNFLVVTIDVFTMQQSTVPIHLEVRAGRIFIVNNEGTTVDNIPVQNKSDGVQMRESKAVVKATRKNDPPIDCSGDKPEVGTTKGFLVTQTLDHRNGGDYSFIFWNPSKSRSIELAHMLIPPRGYFYSNYNPDGLSHALKTCQLAIVKGKTEALDRRLDAPYIQTYNDEFSCGNPTELTQINTRAHIVLRNASGPIRYDCNSYINTLGPLTDLEVAPGGRLALGGTLTKNVIMAVEDILADNKRQSIEVQIDDFGVLAELDLPRPVVRKVYTSNDKSAIYGRGSNVTLAVSNLQPKRITVYKAKIPRKGKMLVWGTPSNNPEWIKTLEAINNQKVHLLYRNERLNKKNDGSKAHKLGSN